MKTNEITSIINDLKKLGNPQKAECIQRFFKTKKGQYGYGDIFWGITVPQIRKVASSYKHLTATQLERLLEHKVHEIRLCALLIMVFRTTIDSKNMYDLYLEKTNFINNWDLVDLSAPVIVGNYLLNKNCKPLLTLAKSSVIWERRIAIVSTYAFIKQGQYEHTLKIARILINDQHDLIHKAVGWMLREVGKRCSTTTLEIFLDNHAANMPRTMLRYAIEHLPLERKKYFMAAKQRSVYDTP